MLSDPPLMSSHAHKPETEGDTDSEKSDAILQKIKTSSHTKEMSDIFGG